jgi:DNA polymerase V
MKPLFALVDCNNFYVSCERLFRPDVADKPAIVLSNNDGCAVARSHEVKALGVKMGTPFFQLKHLIHKHGIQVFSSNYTLYADISSRVMSTLEAMAPGLEVYSIDEAFLDLTGLEDTYDLESFGQNVRQRINKDVGIPVCVGIAPTKTLAKLANHAAKQFPATKGVVDLSETHRQRKLMGLVPVGEVWGIGRKISARLQDMGIKTALDLADSDTSLIRKEFSVVVERTLRELNGTSCLAMEDAPPAKQQIVCSRSFGSKISNRADMHEAISGFVARACEKLRGENRVCQTMSVFIRTSPFSNGKPYSKTASGKLVNPTADTREFLALARSLTENIWLDDHEFAKAGVMLSDFSDPGSHQASLFDEPMSSERNESLMRVVDKINQQGKSKIEFASQTGSKGWSMKREFLSPSYTTNWSDLPKVK